MDIQARIPPACCCIHNIIRRFDSLELEDVVLDEVLAPLPEEAAGIHGGVGAGVATNADRDAMSAKREQIGLALWHSYAEERQRRGDPIPNFQVSES